MQGYLDLASRVGTRTRQRAQAVARSLVSGGGATAEQVGAIADDLVSTSRANREAVAALVRLEVERALGRLGLATSEEVRAINARLAAVEGSARAAAAQAAAKPPRSTPKP
jgi:polyhydroxyalkanoate synthesis regulator phasin